MQSYLGSLEALNDPRNAALRQPRSPHPSPRAQLKLKQQKLVESSQRNERIEARRKKIEGINVNVSGKCYVIAYQKLNKYPKSLLADPKKRRKFYDFKKKEYFFDHNRSVAEAIYNFYQHGKLLRPPNIPEQLFADELLFFGVYEYLNEEQKDGMSGITSPDHVYEDERYNLRRYVWLLLEKPEANMITRLYNLFSLGIILFSVFLLCIDTYGEQVSSTGENATNYSQPRTKLYRKSQNKNSWIFVSEATCIAFFTLELIARFIVSWNKRQFMKNILNIIDFVAIIPFYISLLLNLSLIGASLSVLRILRIGKIFRVLKISRYTTSLKIIIQTLSSGHRDLWMLFFLLLVQALFYASVTYYCEQWAAVETKFTSIPAALWWAMITSLTVGYGDMIPITTAGKLSGALCAVSGVLVMAPILPIIFDRWTRYNRLSLEAKQRQKFQRKYSQEASQHLNLIRVQTGKNQTGFLF